MPMASVHPEASDNLLEVLRGASIDEEHRTIMSAVVKKVQSAKSGLTEACASVLTGFEVSNQIIRKYSCIDSSPDARFGVREGRPNRGPNNTRRSLIIICLCAYAGFTTGRCRTYCGGRRTEAGP